MSERQLLEGVLKDELYGFLEVDLSVPETWGKGFETFSSLTPREYFQEMSAIFCTSEIPFESFGPHMQHYAREMEMGEKPRVLLVGGMSARKILIATPLLRWYLQHGIEVTKIYQVVEYQKSRCFEGFADTISDNRRAGDLNPDKKIMADVSKITGNASFGCTCMDKKKHTNTCYYKGHRNASQAINEPHFRRLTCLNEDQEFYEVQSAKGMIRLDVPIQIALFVLSYAKLRMLQFHYNFLDRFVSRVNYQLLEMDTDSSYLALSKATLEEVVRPPLKEEYIRLRKGYCKDGPTPFLQYFPRTCCEKHALYDKRVPGVFKTEFVGDEMIGLCSKTYFVDNRELGISKLSCKGVNKSLVENPLQIFRRVLKRKLPETCENKGIREKGNTMYTYKQTQLGFNYFYVKRQVLEDGVSTIPLDLVLTPAKNKSGKGEDEEEITDEQLNNVLQSSQLG